MDHVPLATLETALDHIRSSPADSGLVELIVRRPAPGEREQLAEAQLDPAEGLLGDSWKARGLASKDGLPNPDGQLTLMNARVAALVAGRPERRQLAGDQLYLDLNLSYANIPPGTRLRLGSALIEITDLPHRGCGKFLKRFGIDAQRFVNSAAGRELNLRGVNAKIVTGGTVCVGDAVAIVDGGGISRAPRAGVQRTYQAASPAVCD
jgi:hypothetical protein